MLRFPDCQKLGLALLGAAVPVFLPAALQIDGGTPAANFRFENDPGFIAGEQLTGVGRSIDKVEGTWGTLISPNIVLSANHWHPNVGHSLTFHATNDPAGPSLTRQVIAEERIGDSDLWVGVLNQSLPPDFRVYPMVSQPLSSQATFAALAIYGQQAIMLGRAEDITSLVTNLAAGYNRVDYWFDSLPGDPAADPAIAAIQHLPGDDDFVQYEAYAVIYDSGTPLLMELNGILTLVGITWFNDVQVDIDSRPGQEELRNVTGFSYVGNYASGLAGIIDAFSIDATPGYVTWMEAAFSAGAGLAVTGPAIDSDRDGRINFVEYAYNLDPLDPGSLVPMSTSVIDAGSGSHLQLAGQLRDDPALRYFVLSGNDLSGWNRVDLAFADGAWSSADPARLVVDQATALGGGLWSLVLRDPAPLQPGSPRFLLPGAEPLPY